MNRIVFSDDMRVRKNTLRGAPVRRRRAGSAAKPAQKMLHFLNISHGGVPASTGVWRQDQRAAAPDRHKTVNL